jgi:hypothetical protein
MDAREQNGSRPALVEQVLNRRSAERQSVALAKTGQPSGNRCGGLRFIGGFGQPVTERIQRLIERFIGTLRQAGTNGFPKQLLLFRPKGNGHWSPSLHYGP